MMQAVSSGANDAIRASSPPSPPSASVSAQERRSRGGAASPSISPRDSIAITARALGPQKGPRALFPRHLEKHRRQAAAARVIHLVLKVAPSLTLPRLRGREGWGRCGWRIVRRAPYRRQDDSGIWMTEAAMVQALK